MYKEIFKERLKYARQKTGYTQKEMSDILKINRTTYTHWELGRTEPDIETLGKLSQILETDIGWLIGTEEPKKENKK